MTYYGARELADSMRTVRKNTIAVAQDIPEDKFSYRASEGVRSVGEMFVHVALSPRFQHDFHAAGRTSFEGMDFPKIFQEMAAEEARPRTKAEIVELLTREGEAFVTWLAGLSEEFLGERVTLPEGAAPPSKSRFEMVLSAKEHEMHHRAQLMLVERMLGIVPHLTREMQSRMEQTMKAGGGVRS